MRVGIAEKRIKKVISSRYPNEFLRKDGRWRLASLSRGDIAEIFNVSVQSIDKMRKDGRLPQPTVILGPKTFRWNTEDIIDIEDEIPVGCDPPASKKTRNRIDVTEETGTFQNLKDAVSQFQFQKVDCEGFTFTNFYVNQLEPIHDPERIKFGRSINLKERSSNGYSGNPYLNILLSWKIEPRDEARIISLLTDNNYCHQIRGEMYRFTSLPKLLYQAKFLECRMMSKKFNEDEILAWMEEHRIAS